MKFKPPKLQTAGFLVASRCCVIVIFLRPEGGKQGTGRILRIGTPDSEREPGITSTNQIREDCRKGRKRTVGDLPGVEEAKRGRFAYPHQIQRLLSEFALGFSMENRQQRAGSARSHRVVHLFLRGEEFVDARYVNHYYSE